jgi:hypothetical protein
VALTYRNIRKQILSCPHIIVPASRATNPNSPLQLPPLFNIDIASHEQPLPSNQQQYSMPHPDSQQPSSDHLPQQAQHAPMDLIPDWMASDTSAKACFYWWTRQQDNKWNLNALLHEKTALWELNGKCSIPHKLRHLSARVSSTSHHEAHNAAKQQFVSERKQLEEEIQRQNINKAILDRDARIDYLNMSYCSREFLASYL